MASDYKVPEQVTEQETFIYNLIDSLHTLGSHTGFVLGNLYGLIQHMKEEDVSEKVIEEAEKVYKQVSDHVNQYDNDVYESVLNEWKRLGKPLSMEEHLRRKEKADREDEKRDNYRR